MGLKDRTGKSATKRSIDPAIPGFDKLDTHASVFPVHVAICRHRRGVEVIKRHEELHCRAICADQVLQHEEVYVPAEALEQREELAIPRQRLTEWAALLQVVPTNALQREIKSIRDPSVEPAGTVDGLLAVDPVSRKNHHAANSIADCAEGLVLFLRKEMSDVS